MKTKTIVILVSTLAILALIAAVANAFAKNRKNSLESDLSNSGTGSSEGTKSSSTVSLDENKKLGIGSKGNEVKALQLLYNNKYPSRTPLVVDGDFGSKTLSAVVFVMGVGSLSTTLGAFRAKIEGSTVTPETKSLLTRVLGITF